MPNIRVLVVDDSVVVRRLLSNMLDEEPGIEVAAVAANGRIALAKIPRVQPDIVVLDVDMPELGGLETLVEMETAFPGLPVIMFSALTQRGADATIEALIRGAADYVTKPSRMRSPEEAQEVVRRDLVPKIRAICGRSPGQTAPSAAPPEPRPRPRVESRRHPIRYLIPLPPKVIGIGASTGGPRALHAVFDKLPAGLPVPILIVQHMPPLFTSHLAQQLSKRSNVEVREGEDHAVVLPGQAWVAPGNRHMEVMRVGDEVRLRITMDPPENSCRPSVDVLFRSLAEVYGPSTLAVVLTGMGNDGYRGAREIHGSGGRILAQDRDTSVVWGMPSFIANNGLADRVLPLDEIATELLRRLDLLRPD